MGLGLVLLAGASACSAEVDPPYWAEARDQMNEADSNESDDETDPSTDGDPDTVPDDESPHACLGESCDVIEMTEFSTEGKTGGFGHSAEPGDGTDLGNCAGDLLFHGPLLNAHGSSDWVDAFETALDGNVSGPFALTFSLTTDDEEESTSAQMQAASAELALLEDGSSALLGIGEGAGQRQVSLDRTPADFHFVLGGVLIPVLEVSLEGSLNVECSNISGSEIHLFVPASAGALELEGSTLSELWGDPEAEILGTPNAGWDIRLTGSLVRGVAQ